MNRKLLAVLTLSLAAASHAPAQDADSSGRAVARLSLLSGDVSVRRGDTGEWVAAAINAPLMTEDQVLTNGDSRAEVQFDYAHFARLSGDAELRLADIENRKYLLRLARGTMNFRILRGTEAGAEISTPSIAIRPMKKGIYRISVLEDGSTEVTVRSGEAEIFTPRGSQRLKSGRTLMARGSSEDPEFQFANAGMIDDWDRWNESRDRQLENTRSYDYVSQDISGAEDLDGHGRWVNTPEYGNVWVPSASEGWAPYRNGRWSWVDYYGWNWISYDPWGWAPYHYGRWINRPNFGWCWWPGRITARHYWSPGLVAFFGWGRGGVGVGIGFGNMGWVPLAPFETYYPWYGRGYYGGYRNRTYNNVTIVNNTNITNIYRNARHDNGITSVNAGQFGRGSVNNVRFNRNDIESASMVRGQLPLVPDAASTRMTDRESRVAAGRGATRADSGFYSTRQATRIDRVPFESQRSALQESSRRTFGETGRGGEVAGGSGRGATTTDSNWRRMSENANTPTERSGGRGDSIDTGNRRSADASSPSGGRGGSPSTGGWRRFGDSGASSAVAPTERSGGRGASVDTGSSNGTTSDRGSWRRFGDSTSDRSAPSGRGGSIDSGSTTPRRSTDSGSWRSLGDTPSSGRGASQVDRSSGSTERRSIDRGTFDRGNSDRGGRGSTSIQTAPRISAPPVVRERTPDYGGRSSGGSSRGESRQSAPRMERSAPSAPRMERSAPSAPSGNQGGGSRSEGRSGGRNR